MSGSRINEQKTEILKIGNPDTINHPHIHQLVKDKVKVFGLVRTIKILTGYRYKIKLKYNLKNGRIEGKV